MDVRISCNYNLIRKEPGVQFLRFSLAGLISWHVVPVARMYEMSEITSRCRRTGGGLNRKNRRARPILEDGGVVYLAESSILPAKKGAQAAKASVKPLPEHADRSANEREHALIFLFLRNSLLKDIPEAKGFICTSSKQHGSIIYKRRLQYSIRMSL